MPVIVFNKNHSDIDMSWCDEVVNIMRPHTLGNPYPINHTHTRAVVISRYRIYLSAQLANKASLQYAEIQRLIHLHQQGKTIALLCCCAPLPCHADVIKQIIEGK